MKVLEILQYPNEILLKKAKPVKKITPQLLELIDTMKRTLIHASNPKGVGLAAPQVGKLIQLFVVKESEQEPFYVFINPKVTLSKAQFLRDEPDDTEDIEGCLSLENIWGFLERMPIATVEYMDEKSDFHTKKFTHFMSRIIQHEYDHLQGILFAHRVLNNKDDLFLQKTSKTGEKLFKPLKEFSLISLP